MNKRDEKRLEAKKKELDAIARPFDKFWDQCKKEIKKTIKDMMNGLMYNKKEKEYGGRLIQQAAWWVKIAFVFFAFKGITYWLTGR